jgi:hypothetical protein
VGKKTGWEDSTKQPDWIDIESLMRAMGSLHSGQVGLTILPAGTGFSGGVSVAASIMFVVLPGSALPECISVVKAWPCSTHKSLSAHCFSLLYELDYKISAVYKQESLWK